MWHMDILTVDHSETRSQNWDEGDRLRFLGENGGSVVESHACLRLCGMLLIARSMFSVLANLLS